MKIETRMNSKEVTWTLWETSNSGRTIHTSKGSNSNKGDTMTCTNMITRSSTTRLDKKNSAKIDTNRIKVLE